MSPPGKKKKLGHKNHQCSQPIDDVKSLRGGIEQEPPEDNGEGEDLYRDDSSISEKKTKNILQHTLWVEQRNAQPTKYHSVWAQYAHLRHLNVCKNNATQMKYYCLKSKLIGPLNSANDYLDEVTRNGE